MNQDGYCPHQGGHRLQGDYSPDYLLHRRYYPDGSGLFLLHNRMSFPDPDHLCGQTGFCHRFCYHGCNRVCLRFCCHGCSQVCLHFCCRGCSQVCLRFCCHGCNRVCLRFCFRNFCYRNDLFFRCGLFFQCGCRAARFSEGVPCSSPDVPLPQPLLFSVLRFQLPLLHVLLLLQPLLPLPWPHALCSKASHPA